MKNNHAGQIRWNKLIGDTRSVSVDVACTVYNHGVYLRQALDGILMQETDFPVRVIIHDDASTDNSQDIIQEYLNRYPDRIVAVLEEKNLYQNGKSIWKKMFPYYTAKYIASCEGDDYWTDKRKLQKQIDYLESHPDCAACYHNILPVDQNGKHNEKERAMYIQLKDGDYSEYEVRHCLLKTQTASLVRRNYNIWLSEEDKSRYLKAKCNGDQKQLVVCSAFGQVHYLPDIMAAHRHVISGGDSWSARQRKKTSAERFVETLKRYMEVQNLYEYYHEKKVYPYNHIIDMKLNYFRTRYKEKSKLTAEEKEAIAKAVKVPLYAYVVYFPVLLGRIFRKVLGKSR